MGNTTQAEKLIVRRVRVNRNRTPLWTLYSIGHVKKNLEYDVVDSMPRGEGDEVEIVFFKPDLSKHEGFLSDEDLEKEYELQGLTPADPYSLAAVYKDDPAFADERTTATHWQDAKGNWCSMIFSRCYGERRVDVAHQDILPVYLWYAGIRK